ncbi:MAG TPA: hypothetical protein VF006_11670 [Longimicrobium sp.]
MAAEQGAERGERLASDRVFGVIGGVLLLLGLVFLVRSFLPGGSDTGAGPAGGGIPTLRILSPAPGAEVEQPMVVELDAGAALALGPSGWTADGRHLHLFAGGTEVMATATELQPAGGTRYRWRLHRLPAGETTLRLAWSDERHRTLPQGASAQVPVRLR